MKADTLRRLLLQQIMEPDIRLFNVGKGLIELPGYTIYMYRQGEWYWGSTTKRQEVDLETQRKMVNQRAKLDNGPCTESKLTGNTKMFHDEWNIVCREYELGASARQLAEKYNVSVVSIYRHLGKRGISMQRKHLTTAD